MVCTQVIVAALALQLAFSVVAREDGESHEAGKAGTDVAKGLPSNSRQGDLYSMPSYAGLSEHSGMMMAHIILMVIAWVFVLPIGMTFLQCTNSNSCVNRCRSRLQHRQNSPCASNSANVPGLKRFGCGVWNYL